MDGYYVKIALMNRINIHFFFYLSVALCSKALWAAEVRVPMLPRMGNIHLIWIGSSLKPEQFGHVNSLCKIVAKHRLESGDNLKISLWLDHPLPKLGASHESKEEVGEEAAPGAAKPESKLEKKKPAGRGAGHEMSATAAFEPECEGLLVLRKAEDIFKPAAWGDSPIAGRPVPKAIIERVASTYRYLEQLAKTLNLGSRVRSPQVDLLKLAVVYIYGGIYFDINKDFSKLEFVLKAADWESTFSSGNPEMPYAGSSKDIIVGNTVLLNIPVTQVVMPLASGGLEKIALEMRARVHIPGLITQLSIAKIGSMPFGRGEDHIYNMDYFACPTAGSNTLAYVLSNISDDYGLVSKNPILQLFIRSHYFSSAPWVFSLGGPAAFTSHLNKMAAMHKTRILTIAQTAPYGGSLSWLRPPETNYAVPLLGACISNAARMDKASSALQSLVAGCLTGHTPIRYGSSGEEVPKYMPSIFTVDAEFCLFNVLKQHIKSRGISVGDLAFLNALAAHFDASAHRFESEVKRLCYAKIGLDASAHDSIQIDVDASHQEVMCTITIPKRESDAKVPPTVLRWHVADVSMAALDFNNICNLHEAD
jgi:hypothetical protein